MEDEEETDEDDEDGEEFIPNVGLVSVGRKKSADSENENGALVNLEENIRKLERSILSNNKKAHDPQVRFAGDPGSRLTRSTSLNDDENGTYFLHQQKRKRTFNFPNVKKKYEKTV